jgi:hypothetical protein
MPLLAFVTLAVCAAICLIPNLFLRRRSYPRAQDYFVSSVSTPPAVIRNASIGYVLQMAIFGPFFAAGATGHVWPFIIAAGAFGLGLGVLYVLRGPILAFVDEALVHDRSITLHEFIAKNHGGNARVRVLASSLTVEALCGLIVGEALAISTVLKAILPDDAVSSTGITLTLLMLTVLGTVMAGNSGAMRAVQSQLGLLYLGLFGSAALLFYLQVSELRPLLPHGMLALVYFTAACAVLFLSRRSRYVDTSAFPVRDSAGPDASGREPTLARAFRRLEKILNVVISVFVALIVVMGGMELYAEDFVPILRDSALALQAGSSLSSLTLLALLLLPLCYPIVDVVNWQRIAVFAKDAYPTTAERQAAFRKFFRGYMLESPLLWVFMGLFGAIAAVATETPDDVEVLEDVITQLLSEPNVIVNGALWLLVLAVFATALSTTISLFSASVCAIRYDLLPAVRPDLASAKAAPEHQAVATRRAILAGCAILLAMVAVFFIAGTAASITLTTSDVLAVVLVFYCVQLPFVPLVLGPALGAPGGGHVSARWALAILAVGATVAIVAVAVRVATGSESWLWAAVPASLGTSIALFAAARFWSKGGQTGAA